MYIIRVIKLNPSTVLRDRGRGTGPRSLAARLRALPSPHRDLRRIQTNTQLRKSFIVSSDRKKLRYRDRSNIFGRFPNGMAKTMLGLAW